jgi:hypothetical protein
MGMSNYPRNGRYELFTYSRKTYSFDDPTFGANPAIVDAPGEMWIWLRNQEGCRPLDDTNVAYYLEPKIYIVWKLKWT